MAHLNTNLNGGSGMKLVPKIFWLSLILAIAMIFLKNTTLILMTEISFEPLSDILSYIFNIATWIQIVSFLIVITYLIWLFIREVLFYITGDPIYLVINRRLDYFLQNVGVYMKYNKDKVMLPGIRRVKDENIKAFEIEIIGDKKEKLLSLNSALNSYFSQKCTEYKIIESYEKEGWVRYILTPDYQADQLEGDSLEL